MLFVLDRIKAEIELSQKVETLNILKLEHLYDVVQGEVQEAKALNVLQTSQMSDMILREVQLLQVQQLAEACDLTNLVLRQVQVFQVEPVEILNLRDLIHSEGERDQALVADETLNLADLVVIEAEKLHVGVEADVFNNFNLVVRVVDDFKVCWWSKVKHLSDSIVARVQLDHVLNVRQVLQAGQTVV